MDERTDEIDRRILYRLVEDARNTSAPEIADEMSVSGATIRNRIAQLEDRGIITGYSAAVDYERATGHMRKLVVCTAPVADREALAKKALNVPGVVNVRELLTGQQNVHVVVVGATTDELTAVVRNVAELGLNVEDEHLLHRETTVPFEQFGPADRQRNAPMTDFLSLAGGAEVVELTVSADSPIVGTTLSEANEAGLLHDDVLVIAIERDDTVITPHGNTEIRPDDLVSLFTRDGADADALSVFRSERPA
ncbi:MAG: TrkA C-terminal domain-containing protein [Haloarculaceae archaeon]